MTHTYSLAISTINNTISACVFKDMQVINHIHNPLSSNRSVSKIFSVIESLLIQTEIRYSNITEVFVSVGPGSFTAIRIGLAYVMGLSIAKNIKVYGVSNFQLMAYLARKEKLDYKDFSYIVLDAQRDQVFIQAMNVNSMEELSDCRLVDYSFLETVSKIPCITDQDVYQKLQKNPILTDLSKNVINYNQVRAFELGICGAFLKEKSLTKALVPLYIRLPDAKPSNRSNQFLLNQ